MFDHLNFDLDGDGIADSYAEAVGLDGDEDIYEIATEFEDNDIDNLVLVEDPDGDASLSNIFPDVEDNFWELGDLDDWNAADPEIFLDINEGPPIDIPAGLDI